MAEQDRKSTFPFRSSMIGPAITVLVVLIGVVAGYVVSGRGRPPGAADRNEGERMLSIAVGPAGTVYVGRSSSVAFGEGDSRFPGSLRVYGEPLPPVTALAVDEQGTVYAARGGLVEKLSPEGESLLIWGRGGCEGDPFKTVTGLAAGGGSVFVADAGAKLVYRFDYDGRPLGEIGSKESDPDGIGFMIPSPYFDCAVREGILYVANTGRHRVETYDYEGKRLGHWGEFGSRPHQFQGCCNPTNIALAPDGRVVVSQKGHPVVKVFTREGEYLATFGEGEFPVSARGIDLAVTEGGTILALDPLSGKVRTFALGNGLRGGAR